MAAKKTAKKTVRKTAAKRKPAAKKRSVAAKKTAKKPARKAAVKRKPAPKKVAAKRTVKAKPKASPKPKPKAKPEADPDTKPVIPDVSDLFLPIATPELSEKQRNILKVESLPQSRGQSQAAKAEAAGVTTRYYRDVIRTEVFRRYDVKVARAVYRGSLTQVAHAYRQAGFDGGPDGRAVPDVLRDIMEQEKVVDPKKVVVENPADRSDDDLFRRMCQIVGSVRPGNNAGGAGSTES